MCAVLHVLYPNFSYFVLRPPQSRLWNTGGDKRPAFSSIQCSCLKLAPGKVYALDVCLEVSAPGIFRSAFLSLLFGVRCRGLNNVLSLSPAAAHVCRVVLDSCIQAQNYRVRKSFINP